MSFGYPSYGYQPQYYSQPVPDQLAQLRQNQMQGQMVPSIQQVQAPNFQPAPQPVSAVAPNNGINWVASRQEADAWPIAPGCAVALWDSNNPVIYLRQADSTGKPSTKVYDLVERTNQPAPAPHIDMSEYVRWDKLEEYLSERLKMPSKAVKAKEEE